MDKGQDSEQGGQGTGTFLVMACHAAPALAEISCVTLNRQLQTDFLVV